MAVMPEVDMEPLKTLLYERTDRIARITLNRPARGNGKVKQLLFGRKSFPKS